MTMVQRIMLSMCFGAVMGMFLADVGFLMTSTRRKSVRKMKSLLIRQSK